MSNIVCSTFPFLLFTVAEAKAIVEAEAAAVEAKTIAEAKAANAEAEAKAAAEAKAIAEAEAADAEAKAIAEAKTIAETKATTHLLANRVLESINKQTNVCLNSEEVQELRELNTAVEDQFVYLMETWGNATNGRDDNVFDGFDELVEVALSASDAAGKALAAHKVALAAQATQAAQAARAATSAQAASGI